MSKNARMFYFALLAALAGCNGNKAPAVDASQPYLSLRLRSEDRDTLQQAALALMSSEFETGQKKLAASEIPSEVRVFFVNDSGAGQTAARKAIERWNEALSGNVQILEANNEAESQLRIEFVANVNEVMPGFVRPGCSNIRFLTPSESADTGRIAVIQVGLNRPGSNVAHSTASLEHLVAKRIGSFLGLQRIEKAEGVMGVDTHSDSVPTAPSAEDVAIVRQMLAFRAKLSDAARARSSPKLDVPKLEFETVEHDGGTVWRGEVIRATFKFRNTGRVPVELDAKPNCGCTVAKFDRVVGPGESGAIEAEFDTASFSGRTTKHIDIISNSLDEKKPRLTIKSVIRPTFETVPNGPHTIGVSPGSSESYEFLVVPIENKVSRVMSIDSPNDGVKATLVADGGRSGEGQRIRVDVLPEFSEGRQYVSLTVKTDSKREKEFSIPLIVEKGMCVMPKSLFLGRLDGQIQYPIKRTITLSQKSKPFRILGVESGDPGLTAEVETSKSDTEYRVRLSYRGGWGVGETKRVLTIRTSDPRNPKIDIPISAFVLE